VLRVLVREDFRSHHGGAVPEQLADDAGRDRRRGQGRARAADEVHHRAGPARQGVRRGGHSDGGEEGVRRHRAQERVARRCVRPIDSAAIYCISDDQIEGNYYTLCLSEKKNLCTAPAPSMNST
jgi:hypothetical protein